MTRISLTLVRRNGRICCASCEGPIATGAGSWKEHAALTEVPVVSLPGAGLGVDREVVIRQFSCRACGALLDSESAFSGDPFLEDVVSD
jgi:hypothetical protein